MPCCDDIHENLISCIISKDTIIYVQFMFHILIQESCFNLSSCAILVVDTEGFWTAHLIVYHMRRNMRIKK